MADLICTRIHARRQSGVTDRTGAALGVIFTLCALCVLCARAFAAPERALYGFRASTSSDQRAIERKFSALPSRARAREAHAFLTAEPHVAGSPRDRALA